MEADPTVYEYDNIYDDLKAKKEEKEAALQQKKDKKVCVEFPHFSLHLNVEKSILLCVVYICCQMLEKILSYSNLVCYIPINFSFLDTVIFTECDPIFSSP